MATSAPGRGEGAEAGPDSSDDPELDAFLAEQARLAEMQTQRRGPWWQAIQDHLRREDLRRRLPAALELILVLAAMGVLVALAMIDRRNDERHSAVIQPFSPAATRQGLKF